MNNFLIFLTFLIVSPTLALGQSTSYTITTTSIYEDDEIVSCRDCSPTITIGNNTVSITYEDNPEYDIYFKIATQSITSDPEILIYTLDPTPTSHYKKTQYLYWINSGHTFWLSHQLLDLESKRDYNEYKYK
jgi:hypothetical protein